MAATMTPVLLSGSTSGRPIKVAATATTGTTIHTCVSGATNFDQVFLYAHNTSASSVVLTIEQGGTTSPDDLLTVTIEPKAQKVTLIPGERFNGGVVIRAFAATANVITITGSVDRYTA